MTLGQHLDLIKRAYTKGQLTWPEMLRRSMEVYNQHA